MTGKDKSPIEQAREFAQVTSLRSCDRRDSVEVERDILELGKEIYKLADYAESLERENKRLTEISQTLCSLDGHNAPAFDVIDGVDHCGICAAPVKTGE